MRTVRTRTASSAITLAERNRTWSPPRSPTRWPGPRSARTRSQPFSSTHTST
ncbi:MAG TPA: hypothetical protein VFW50_33455 [Streptosporangiaceae bacterium]|nr:hypothetical protein [Streptosporangiaceae bacterium]